MPSNLDCLAALVGLLSEKPTEPVYGFPYAFDFAFAPGSVAAFTFSTTGLYVENVEGLSLRTLTEDCPSDLPLKLAKARSQAIQHVASQLGRTLSSDTPRFKQSGLLGGAGNGSYGPQGSPARLTLKTKYREGGALRLDTLLLYTDQALSDIPVLLDGAEIARISTNDAPAALSQVLVPLDGQAHVLEAVLPEGVRVRVNSITCGCGNPFVAAMRLDLQDVTSPAGGFAVQLSEACSLPAGLCYTLDTDEELARSVGFAIQYTAAANLAISLLVDTLYSRYTLLEPKALQSLIDLWNSKAFEHLSWLNSPQGLSRVQHPCTVCQPSSWHPSIVSVR